jgi:hypothetical protein
MTITGHKTASCFRRYGIINNDDKVAALQQLQRWQQAQQQIGCNLTVKPTQQDKLTAATGGEKVQ